MKKFEILEHKADLKIRAFGKTKEELLENLMLAMLEGARYEKNLQSQTSKVEVKISSMDLPSLLVDFLSEVLYLCETRKEVYQKVEFKKFLETPKQNKFATGQVEIEATLTGKKLERMGVHIKAVTYHGLDIHRKGDGIWQATVLFDI